MKNLRRPKWVYRQFAVKIITSKLIHNSRMEMFNSKWFITLRHKNTARKQRYRKSTFREKLTKPFVIFWAHFCLNKNLEYYSQDNFWNLKKCFMIISIKYLRRLGKYYIKYQCFSFQCEYLKFKINLIKYAINSFAHIL